MCISMIAGRIYSLCRMENSSYQILYDGKARTITARAIDVQKAVVEVTFAPDWRYCRE